MTAPFMPGGKNTIKFSMGSDIQPGQTVQRELSLGNALTGITLSGSVTVKQNNAGADITVPLNWNMIDTYQFKLNGNSIHDLSGSAMFQWLMINDFITLSPDLDADDIYAASQQMSIPFFPNFLEPNARTLAFINNGANTLVNSMTLLLKLKTSYRTGAGNTGTYTIQKAAINYQMHIANGNLPDNNEFCMSIKSRKKVIDIIGVSTIEQFASRGLLTQLYITPVPQSDATKVEIVNYDNVELQVSGTTFDNLYAASNRDFAKNSSWRNAPMSNPARMEFTRLPSNNYLMYEPAWNGNGLNVLFDGNENTQATTGLDLTNVTTFGLKIDVESIAQSDGRAEQEIIQTYIQAIL